MADLSPAAQAVHDAFWSHPNGKPLVQDCPDTDQLVAALRTVAHHLQRSSPWPNDVEGIGIDWCTSELHDIAAELKAHS